MLGKISFIILFSINFQIIYSQDIMMERLEKLFLEKDSLERVLQPLKVKNEGLNDNLEKAKDAYNKLKKEYDVCVENSKK